jgi:outer membrane protein W
MLQTKFLKMKKTFALIAVLAVLLFASNSQAQNFFVKLGGGYALSLASQNISTTSEGTNIEGHYGSYGEGILPALTLGYTFNKNIGIEVAGTYLIGKKFEHTHTTAGLTETHKEWGEGILISPSVFVQAPMKNVTPYARFGGVVGMVKVKEETTESGTGARTGTDKVQHSGKMGLGMNGALGIKFKAGKMLDIFAELFGTAMNYGPEKRENTETYSGGTLDPTITYEESYSTTSTNTSLTPRFPFSNFGLNVGVILTFGKQPKTK